MDEKLKEWEKKIRGKRREVGGTNAGSNFAAHSKKQEKVFENRLDHVRSEFSMMKMTCSILIFFNLKGTENIQFDSDPKREFARRNRQLKG